MYSNKSMNTIQNITTTTLSLIELKELEYIKIEKHNDRLFIQCQELRREYRDTGDTRLLNKEDLITYEHDNNASRLDTIESEIEALKISLKFYD
jgi:hypothetical protein